MAEGLNKVMLLGNLGADPELRVTATGQAILKLRLATSETFLDKNQTRQERTEWHQVTLWGKRGEALSKFLGKGDRIFIEGSVRTSTYEKDGEKRYRTEVVASNVLLCGGKRREGAPSAAGDKKDENTPVGVSGDVPPSDYGDYAGGDDDIPF